MPIHGNVKLHRLERNACLVARVSASFVVVLLIGASGCVDFSQATPGTVRLEVVLGEVAGGNLFTDQTLRATASVEAGHVYELVARLVVSVGSIGSGEIEGVVSGTPLAQSVTFTVATSGDGALEDQSGTTFIAKADGEVIITFDFPSHEDSSVGDALQALRDLINGPVRGIYGLLLSDRGFDDNGTSPADAVTLTTDAAGERTGTLGPADEADYFLLDVIAGATYQLRLEATGSVNLSLGSEDRFGHINFGVPSAGGLTIAVGASAGVPGSAQFTAPATESVYLRLSASGTLSSDDDAIQYAISVVEMLP